jgi:signal transduction histidine kinase
VSRTPSFVESRFLLSALIPAGGSVEVAYPPEMAGIDPAPFLPEERSLIEKAAADISEAVERSRLEAQLLHADRLATVGVLAAGIAHELNEPLASILGFAQLVGKCAGLPDQAGRDAAQIVQSCLRAREIVRGLLIFGGSAPEKTEDCELGQIVREGIRFLEPRCRRESIALSLDLAPDVPLVRGDPAQLTQVLVNLVVNAVQAMPTGGTFTVRTRADGNAALLIVQDTGVGMSAETMGRIFVPFFTTKGTGRGTGLGLAVVHGIVTSMRGTIGVTSDVGKGSRFEVRLPARERGRG